MHAGDKWFQHSDGSGLNFTEIPWHFWKEIDGDERDVGQSQLVG